MRRRSREEKDHHFTALLAKNDQYVIGGSIGGLRDGKFQYFHVHTLEAAMQVSPWEFRQPVTVSDATAPTGVAFETTEYVGLTVTAGYDKKTQTWYVKRGG
jgi:hypothetical protein